MAVFNLTIAAKPIQDIEEISNFSGSCHSLFTFKVNVPATTTRYVSITANDVYGFPTSVVETITSEKTYNLNIDGAQGSSNNILSNFTVIVRENNSTGSILVNKKYSRQHNGQYC